MTIDLDDLRRQRAAYLEQAKGDTETRAALLVPEVDILIENSPLQLVRKGRVDYKFPLDTPYSVMDCLEQHYQQAGWNASIYSTSDRYFAWYLALKL